MAKREKLVTGGGGKFKMVMRTPDTQPYTFTLKAPTIEKAHDEVDEFVENYLLALEQNGIPYNSEEPISVEIQEIH